MIVITGATGNLGSLIVQRLLARVPATSIGVSVRDPDLAGGLAERGVRVRRGDFTDPASLATAFEGATCVLVISANAHGEVAISQNCAAIAAACAAGAQHIFYTSHQGASFDSLFGPMKVHAATEQFLAETGTPFTALRHGFYASTVPFLFGPAVQTGQLVAPADGPVSWTAHTDLAEAAAILLTGNQDVNGATSPLTAPVAYDLSDVAAKLTEISGRAVERVVIDDDDWTAGLLKRGLPDTQVKVMMGMIHAIRRGEFATTGPTLERLLGRTVTPLRSTLATLITD